MPAKVAVKVVTLATARRGHASEVLAEAAEIVTPRRLRRQERGEMHADVPT
jgi:hypothetical protein